MISNQIALYTLQNLTAAYNTYYKTRVSCDDIHTTILAKFKELEDNAEQLRKCKDFKDSYGKRMLEENKRLKDRSDRLEMELAESHQRIDSLLKDQ